MELSPPLIFDGLALSTISRHPKEFLFIERHATELADFAPVAHHNDTMANVDQARRRMTQ